MGFERQAEWEYDAAEVAIINYRNCLRTPTELASVGFSSISQVSNGAAIRRYTLLNLLSTTKPFLTLTPRAGFTCIIEL